MPDIEQWRRDWQRWGPLPFFHIRLMVAVKPWFTLCRVHVREHRTEAPAAVDCVVRIATRTELMSAAGDPAMSLRPESIDAALSRGDICVAAFDGNRIVAYVWRSFSTAPHIEGLWVRFDRPYRYGYKALTLPEFRGRHLQDALALSTDALCNERGFTKGVGIVESHNYPSVRSDLRRGNRLAGWAGYFSLFGKVYPFRSPGARKHTFRFVRH
jgi:hypothetical protein